MQDVVAELRWGQDLAAEDRGWLGAAGVVGPGPTRRPPEAVQVELVRGARPGPVHRLLRTGRSLRWAVEGHQP